MKLIFEKSTLFVLSLASISLVVLLAWFYFNAKTVKSSSDLVEHTEEVLRKSTEVLTDVLAIEAETRGFVLTGNEIFLEPFQSEGEKITANLTALKTLTKDNPKQQTRIDSMMQTGGIRIVELKNTIEASRKGQISAAEKTAFVNKGLLLSSMIHSRIGDFNAEEFRLLGQRKLENERASGVSEWLFSAFLFFLLAVFALFALLLFNQKNKNKYAADQKLTADLFSTELTEAKVFAELATMIAEEAKGKAEAATKIAEDATLVAENAVRAKQQFLSNMSHEIRTPMNAIIGFTKVVLKTDLSAKQKEYLTAIKMSGDALIVLLNDILDLAKVDSGKMTFEKTPFKMADSIAAMLHVFETKIQEKNLRLLKNYDPKIPEVLVGDPARLHQIILNLVSNAVKFTARGGITVSALLVDEDAEKATVEFSVRDTGIGIADEKKALIFENFQQATSGTSRLFGGTGLGLAIVKQLIELQGGSISVKSKLGEGSVFSFALDFQKTAEKVLFEAQTPVLGIEARSIKVLVVEDMPLNQLLMKTILDDFGFERDIADNGKIAIQKLQTKSYDIILMDLQMPEMNGFEATEHIRKTMNSKIPIIALTADVTTTDLAKCTAVGMNDYLAKPIDEKLLFQKIVGLVKKTSKTLPKSAEIELKKGQRFTDLHFLTNRTKANPDLMMEMIAAYLEQTPPLVAAMKQSLADQNWEMLHAAVHKMIPSFSIMGIHSDYELMAKKVQAFAHSQEMDGVQDLVLQLENVCSRACEELQTAFTEIKNTRA